MTLNNLGNNKTELRLANGNVIFFSYNTPVAANVDGKFVRTRRFFSKTTSKHINRWLDGRKAEVIDHEDLEALSQV